MASGPSEDHVSIHVHQATGMIAAQADCDVEEAMNRLVIRAAATGVSIEDLALDVLDRRVRFD
jgi:hypothetical protein